MSKNGNWLREGFIVRPDIRSHIDANNLRSKVKSLHSDSLLLAIFAWVKTVQLISIIRQTYR